MWPPQIDCLRKTSPVLRISTHIYEDSMEIHGKTFILRVNLGMLTLKSNRLWKNEHCSEGLNTHLWGFYGDTGRIMFIFSVNLGMSPLKWIILEKQALILRVSTHIYSVSKDIGGKMFIFSTKPRHVTPQIESSWKKRTLSWWFQHAFIVFPRDICEKMFIYSSKSGHVTPQIDSLGKMRTVLMVSTHIYSGFQGHRWKNIHFSD